MKTRNTELLVSLMAIRKQLNNLNVYQSGFDYNNSIELIENSIEIAKMNIINEAAVSSNR